MADVSQCYCCNGVRLVEEMHQVEVFEARQTHSSPAEYGEALVCSDCFYGDGPEDAEFVRADLKYRERTGSHL
jgi:hypothetical protein